MKRMKSAISSGQIEKDIRKERQEKERQTEKEKIKCIQKCRYRWITKRKKTKKKIER